MAKSRLRLQLEKRAGERQLTFRIPYTLLPPRYKQQHFGRDMLVIFGQDFEISLTWDSLLTNKQEISKGEARRLFGEVTRKVTRYRHDLGIFARFCEAWSEDISDYAPEEILNLEEALNDGQREKVEKASRPAEAWPQEKEESEGERQEGQEVEIIDNFEEMADSVLGREPKDLEELLAASAAGDIPYPDFDY